jgi:uncharacterized protein (DUF58 family)
MKRSRSIAWLLPLVLVVGNVTTASAVILLVVIQMLTLFSSVGLSFVYSVEVRAVADPPEDVAACDIVIDIRNEHGEIVDAQQDRVPAGKMLSLQYGSRRSPGETDIVRAVVKSKTVPRDPLPPGPCPILASMQLVNTSTGETEAVILPVVQRVTREVILVP